MGCIFKPEELTWEDIEGGRGDLTREAIKDFINEYCYPDEPVNYENDEGLASELVLFAEAWEKIDGYPLSRSSQIADAYQTAAVLSLIDGAFYNSMAADSITEKLTKSATKLDLVEIMTHVASAFCWYISLKARVERAERAE